MGLYRDYRIYNVVTCGYIGVIGYANVCNAFI